MLNKKLAGPGASARKYDLITALGAHALSLGKHDQRLVLRLITLITARYNWARDELCVGQREIGNLWSCDPRTVKRELAKLRGLGWLILKRQGARGRVATYGLDTGAVLAATRPSWPSVGPDFVVRMDPVRPETIVPFPASADSTPPSVNDASEWSLARAILYQQDPGRFGAWIKALQRRGRAGGRLQLTAPSRFHAAYVQTHLEPQILAACQSADDTIGSVEITD